MGGAICAKIAKEKKVDQRLKERSCVRKVVQKVDCVNGKLVTVEESTEEEIEEERPLPVNQKTYTKKGKLHRWTLEEEQKLKKLFQKYKNDFPKIASELKISTKKVKTKLKKLRVSENTFAKTFDKILF